MGVAPRVAVSQRPVTIVVARAGSSPAGYFQMSTMCPYCRGEGQIVRDKCGECSGKGRVATHRKVSVTVPAGVDTGNQLRLNGEGDGGVRGGT